jgi:hypothetical protein
MKDQSLKQATALQPLMPFNAYCRCTISNPIQIHFKERRSIKSLRVGCATTREHRYRRRAGLPELAGRGPARKLLHCDAVRARPMTRARREPAAARGRHSTAHRRMTSSSTHETPCA